MASGTRRRLDIELLRRGLTESRQQARHLIDAGRVLVSNAPADKAGRLVAPGEPIHILGPPARYVGRGGEKLAGALDRFDIDPTGKRSEEHTSELQSLMRNSYAVSCLKKK